MPQNLELPCKIGPWGIISCFKKEYINYSVFFSLFQNKLLFCMIHTFMVERSIDWSLIHVYLLWMQLLGEVQQKTCTGKFFFIAFKPLRCKNIQHYYYIKLVFLCLIDLQYLHLCKQIWEDIQQRTVDHFYESFLLPLNLGDNKTNIIQYIFACFTQTNHLISNIIFYLMAIVRSGQ